MKICAATVTALSLSLIFAAPSAFADVTVDPSDVSPNIYLHAKKHRPVDHQRSRTHTRTADVDNREVDPTVHRKLRCMTEPDGSTYCFGNGAVPDPDAKSKTVTPAQILEAVREIGLPSLKISIQPSATTLVNLDTIFYAQPQPFNKSVNLLDYAIDLTATPINFIWRHGDGTSHTTQTAGAPYPSTAVTYRYKKPAKSLHPSVDVTYQVRYRIDGGAWQTLAQTLRASGPASNLQVKEAAAVLAGN